MLPLHSFLIFVKSKVYEKNSEGLLHLKLHISCGIAGEPTAFVYRSFIEGNQPHFENLGEKGRGSLLYCGREADEFRAKLVHNGAPEFNIFPNPKGGDCGFFVFSALQMYTSDLVVENSSWAEGMKQMRVLLSQLVTLDHYSEYKVHFQARYEKGGGEHGQQVISAPTTATDSSLSPAPTSGEAAVPVHVAANASTSSSAPTSGEAAVTINSVPNVPENSEEEQDKEADSKEADKSEEVEDRQADDTGATPASTTATYFSVVTSAKSHGGGSTRIVVKCSDECSATVILRDFDANKRVPEARVNTVNVPTNQRLMGHGRRALKAAYDFVCAWKGWSKIKVVVNPSSNATGFYRKCGFQSISKLPDMSFMYNAPPLPTCSMLSLLQRNSTSAKLFERIQKIGTKDVKTGSIFVGQQDLDVLIDPSQGKNKVACSIFEGVAVDGLETKLCLRGMVFQMQNFIFLVLGVWKSLLTYSHLEAFGITMSSTDGTAYFPFKCMRIRLTALPRAFLGVCGSSMLKFTPDITLSASLDNWITDKDIETNKNVGFASSQILTVPPTLPAKRLGRGSRHHRGRGDVDDGNEASSDTDDDGLQ